MHKFFITIFCILICGMNAGAVVIPENFYSYSENFDVKFQSLSADEVKNLDKETKKVYKKLLKNEKFLQKGKYSKAENLYPDFIPNMARFTNIYEGRTEYKKALDYALKIKAADNTKLFSRFAKDYKIGVLYSLNGDYLNSNKYLTPYLTESYEAVLQVARNYFYMQDLKTAEQYAAKIKTNSDAYFSAQELLFSIYEITKQPAKAYTAAAELIKYAPANPENYMRLASVTTNRQEKLRNYYRAKRIFYTQNAAAMIVNINKLTAPLEQQKIDEVYKKLTIYCKKPDWFKIKSRNEGMLDNDIQYWDKRQSEFFESANDCMERYSGTNLVACFNDLNLTQEKLDKDLIAENTRRTEEAQREAQIRLLVRQNALLEEQNRLEWSRYYNYYPRYYRRGYWW